MKTNNERLNTARMVANNGQDFADGAVTITGVFYGFQPGGSGCKISAVTIENSDGDSIDETHADWVNLIDTTASLEGFVSAGLVKNQNGYFTSITFSDADGSAMVYRDTLEKVI